MLASTNNELARRLFETAVPAAAVLGGKLSELRKDVDFNSEISFLTSTFPECSVSVFAGTSEDQNVEFWI